MYMYKNHLSKKTPSLSKNVHWFNVCKFALTCNPACLKKTSLSKRTNISLSNYILFNVCIFMNRNDLPIKASFELSQGWSLHTSFYRMITVITVETMLNIIFFMTSSFIVVVCLLASIWSRFLLANMYVFLNIERPPCCLI